MDTPSFGQYKSTTAGSGTGCGATREAEMVEAPTNSLVKYNLRLTSPTNHAKTSGPSGQQRAWGRTPSSAPRAPASSGLPRESGGSTPDLWKHPALSLRLACPWGAACRWGGGGPSRRGWPSTVVRGVWCQALSLPRLSAGCRGPLSTCCGRGCGCVWCVWCLCIYQCK